MGFDEKMKSIVEKYIEDEPSKHTKAELTMLKDHLTNIAARAYCQCEALYSQKADLNTERRKLNAEINVYKNVCLPRIEKLLNSKKFVSPSEFNDTVCHATYNRMYCLAMSDYDLLGKDDQYALSRISLKRIKNTMVHNLNVARHELKDNIKKSRELFPNENIEE